MLIFGGRRCWLIPNTGLPETNSKLAPAKMDGWFNTILFFWVGCYVGFRECTWHGGCWTKCRNQGCGGIRRPSDHQFWDVHVVRTLIPHASIILGMQLNACKCLETEVVPLSPPFVPIRSGCLKPLDLQTYSNCLPHGDWEVSSAKLTAFTISRWWKVEMQRNRQQQTKRHVDHVEIIEITVIQSTDMCFEHHQVANLKLNHSYLGTDGSRFVTVAAFLVCKDKIRWTKTLKIQSLSEDCTGS